MDNFNAEKHMSAYILERHRRGLNLDTSYIYLSCASLPGEKFTFRNKDDQAKCIVEILKPYIKSHRLEIANEFSDNPGVLKLIGFSGKIQENNSRGKVKAPTTGEPAPEVEGFPTDDTGYVKGEPFRHAEGLSTFEVDNTGTNRDAVVRIYLNGNKPASRTILVKAGEKFTAKNIAPGNYKMRYRFSDSKKVFEAKTLFSVSEEKTQTGTRYSQITVTLYKTKDGNMQTEEVTENDF
jgi:lipoprotein-anchoring transpeptidase ErfK/SrfK